MPETRDTDRRVQKGVKDLVKEMDYPFSQISQKSDDPYYYYDVAEILKPILVETPEEKADPGPFPTNIQDYFWIQPGENEGQDWIACGTLTNGAFFFYKGWCDYTGFDCQGGMDLYVSKSWANIVNHAMIQDDYLKYMNQTVLVG
jgi:hypothetical protein